MDFYPLPEAKPNNRYPSNQVARKVVELTVSAQISNINDENRIERDRERILKDQFSSFD